MTQELTARKNELTQEINNMDNMFINGSMENDMYDYYKGLKEELKNLNSLSYYN